MNGATPAAVSISRPTWRATARARRVYLDSPRVTQVSGAGLCARAAAQGRATARLRRRLQTVRKPSFRMQAIRLSSRRSAMRAPPRAVGVELESRARHCERSEAIHEVVRQRPFTVDCFVAALLAMTWFHLKAARSSLARVDVGRLSARPRSLQGLALRASAAFSATTLAAEGPAGSNADLRNVSTIALASSGPITRAPMVMICASLLLAARSAE